tara:strand:- start:7271 stop:7435 length:165 start_codon:yes stop_codon:yes gene_type:complete
MKGRFLNAGMRLMPFNFLFSGGAIPASSQKLAGRDFFGGQSMIETKIVRLLLYG